MKIITGQVPNLSWWKCLQMSDEEIKEFNDKHLKVEEMYCVKCDKEHNDVWCPTCSTFRIVGIEKALAPSVFEVEIWNAAIEAAAIKADWALGTGISEDIRKLKK